MLSTPKTISRAVSIAKAIQMFGSSRSSMATGACENALVVRLKVIDAHAARRPGDAKAGRRRDGPNVRSDPDSRKVEFASASVQENGTVDF
jgi:hypothetical protein